MLTRAEHDVQVDSKQTQTLTEPCARDLECARTPTRRIRILSVDDDIEAADSIKIVLGIEGFEVVTAYSGMDALARLASDPPDVVLLDIRMPDLSGFTVAQRIRGMGHARLKLVALSSIDFDLDSTAPELAFFDVVCMKPVRVSDLIDVIRHLSGTPEADQRV
jgi:CheY-like chemotaxis protein